MSGSLDDNKNSNCKDIQLSDNDNNINNPNKNSLIVTKSILEKENPKEETKCLKRGKFSSALKLCFEYEDYALYGSLTANGSLYKYFGIDYMPKGSERLLIQIGDRYGDKVFLFVAKQENRKELAYYFVHFQTLCDYYQGKFVIIILFIILNNNLKKKINFIYLE